MLRSLTQEHGDIVSLKMLGQQWFIVSHPDNIEQVFIKHARVMLRDAQIDILKRALGQGLLTSDGDLWKRQRKLMSVAFSPRRIQGYGDAMARVTARGLDDVRAGEVINLHQLTSKLTMEVVSDVLFGTGVSADDVARVSHALETLNEFFANSPEAVFRIPPNVPTPRNVRVRKAIAEIDDILYRIISARRGAPARDDLLGTLLAAQDDDGAGMSDEQLRDEAVTLFLAGHETTSLALAHTLYLLSKHPAVERARQAEQRAVLGGRLPTSEDAKRLVYTERVLKESMRLYPPAWTTGREAGEAIQLGDVTIPKGAQILISQWVVHRDPRFFPNPEGFDPDRWEPERAAKLPRFAYFPFGGGPRVCIGNHFAMLEATLMLAVILQRFRVELLPGERLELKPSVTLRQRGSGLRVRMFERRDAARAEAPFAASAAE